jgi:DNA-binding transcriptional LysR family regulator
LDLTQLRYFLALSKTLNFTSAAEACNVTQPALTKSIQRLEGELGGALLLREPDRAQLTPLGAAMLPLLQRTFDAAETARAGARHFRQQELALLRLGIGPWIEPALFGPLIDEVRRRFVHLELTMANAGTTALNDGLVGAEFDVVLTADAQHLTERADRWPIFADPIVALLPEDHALSACETIDTEQLRRQPLIGRLPEGGAAQDLEAMFGVTPAIRHRVSAEDHLHVLLRAGMGIALSAGRRLVPPGIVRRRVAPSLTLDVVVAAMAGRPLSRAADAFLRLARARDWNAV